MGVAAGAVGAATGGLGGIAIAAAVGAASKTTLDVTDELYAGTDYTLKDLGESIIDGGVAGLAAGAAGATTRALFTGSNVTSQGSRLLQFSREVAEETVDGIVDEGVHLAADTVRMGGLGEVSLGQIAATTLTSSIGFSALGHIGRRAQINLDVDADIDTPIARSNTSRIDDWLDDDAIHPYSYFDDAIDDDDIHPFSYFNDNGTNTQTTHVALNSKSPERARPQAYLDNTTPTPETVTSLSSTNNNTEFELPTLITTSSNLNNGLERMFSLSPEHRNVDFSNNVDIVALSNAANPTNTVSHAPTTNQNSIVHSNPSPLPFAGPANDFEAKLFHFAPEHRALSNPFQGDSAPSTSSLYLTHASQQPALPIPNPVKIEFPEPGDAPITFSEAGETLFEVDAQFVKNPNGKSIEQFTLHPKSGQAHIQLNGQPVVSPTILEDGASLEINGNPFTVDDIYLKNPDHELEKSFVDLLTSRSGFEFPYTALGTKPVSYLEFSPERVDQIREVVQGIGLEDELVFVDLENIPGSNPNVNGHHGSLLADKASLEVIVDRNIQEFQRVIHTDLQASDVVQAFENPDTTEAQSIIQAITQSSEEGDNEYNLLLGIVLGYGTENSRVFNRRNYLLDRSEGNVGFNARTDVDPSPGFNSTQEEFESLLEQSGYIEDEEHGWVLNPDNPLRYRPRNTPVNVPSYIAVPDPESEELVARFRNAHQLLEEVANDPHPLTAFIQLLNQRRAS